MDILRLKNNNKKKRVHDLAHCLGGMYSRMETAMSVLADVGWVSACHSNWNGLPKVSKSGWRISRANPFLQSQGSECSSLPWLWGRGSSGSTDGLDYTFRQVISPAVTCVCLVYICEWICCCFCLGIYFVEVVRRVGAPFSFYYCPSAVEQI